jgi:hypothetical protein
MRAVPAGDSFATNAASVREECLVWKAPAVVGKFAEEVEPATYAISDASTAMAAAESAFAPPR